MTTQNFGRRRPLFLLVSLLAAGAPLLAAEGDQANLTVLDPSVGSTAVRLELNGFDSQVVTIGGVDHVRLSFDDEGWTTSIGAPQLPRVSRSILLPDTGALDVEIISASFHDITDVLIAPYRGPISRAQDPSSVPYTFGSEYTSDAFFPSELVALRDAYIMRDARGVVADVQPLQYNPVTGVLRVYDEITFRVNSNGRPGSNEIDRPNTPSRGDVSFADLYETHFINYQPARYAPLNEVGDILVISHGAFMTTMQPYVDWKISRGINTTIVDVASIGNNTNLIKNHIQGVYAASNLAYVLLVGDIAEIKSGDYSGGKSDPYYSTMTADWYPDLIVGRFSAQNTSQVATQVQRTLDYEAQNHDYSGDAWNCQGMGIASNQGPGHYGEYDNAHMNLIRGDLLSDGCTTVDQIYDPSGSSTMVRNGLNAGRRMVNYCGHGSMTSWGTTGFSNGDINNLTNVGMLPFIHSVACVNGEFDAGTCFGEAWLRATSGGQPTGAVAAYMSSINQYWDEPMYAQDESADLFCAETYSSVGALWYAGSCSMMDDMGNSGRDMFMTWILFGDPALMVHGDNCTGSAANYCISSPNSAGAGAVIGSNSDYSVASNSFQLNVSGAPANKPGLFFYGPNQISIPFGEGRRCVGGSLYRLGVLTTSGQGTALRAIDFTSLPNGGGIVGGSSWNFQFWYRDPAGGPVGYNTSDGLAATFCP